MKLKNKDVVDYLLDHIKRQNTPTKNSKIVVTTNPVAVRIDQPLDEKKATLFCFLAFIAACGILGCF